MLSCRERDLPIYVDYVKIKHNINYSNIITYKLVDQPQELLLVFAISDVTINIPTATVVHRKAATETVYTINGLNKLIIANNNGILDKTYKVDWSLYEHCFITTKNNELTKITLQRI